LRTDGMMAGNKTDEPTSTAQELNKKKNRIEIR
jgi:hypothetical protein